MITAEQRDVDIHTLSAVNSKLSTDPRLRVVLTGSYAIEALVQTPVDHKDMDENIFVTDLAPAITRTAVLMGDLDTEQGKLCLFKQTGDRLEYNIGPRRLEFQFVEEKTPQIPTVLVQLRDSNQEAFEFLVKSLPYTIATWAIRISGEARNPLRPVRKTDLDNFAILLAAKFKLNDVISAMNDHPQMPEDTSESEVLERALAAAGKRLKL